MATTAAGVALRSHSGLRVLSTNSTATLTVTIDAWPNGGPIPEEYAFCVPADVGHITMGRNRNPALRWSGAPAGTRSYALICHDPDVPSKPDAVNKEGVTVNRWPTTGFLASSAASNEAGYLTVKTVRALGITALDTQARI